MPPSSSDTAITPSPAAPLPAEIEDLVEDLLDDLRRRRRAGERPATEEYLARHPRLRDHPAAAAELIYEEVCLRHEYGQGGAVSDVLRRFPEWREQLQVVLNFHRLLGAGGPASFPDAGDSLGEFRLLAELGKGAHGRVFLATQPALAGRPVVLKLAPLAGREHLSLARLQHTHIVPLYSAQDFPERNLRALCMPYFGGVTLTQALEALREHPPERRSGGHFLQVLRQFQEAAPVALPVGGRGCQFLERATYAQAVCSIGAALADALQYAEDRGLLHLDLKPSNVLLGADGQPMLLDFHLARGPIAAGDAAPPWLGGTPGYMAPEQVRALDAVRSGAAVPVAVDGRADVYALGLLLYEMLGGTLPLANAPFGRLRRRNPDVTVGLSDVIRKCLAPDPADRYPGGAALAADLRRHLADLPLRGVPNRSPLERWRKWRRRRPNFLPLAVFLAVLLGVGGLAVGHARGRLDKARDALLQSHRYLERDKSAEALRSLERGLGLAEGLPFSGPLVAELREEKRRVRQWQQLQQLHGLAERIRALHGSDSLGVYEARKLEPLCRLLWERRESIRQRLHATPDSKQWGQIVNDLLSLSVLLADLRARTAEPDQAAAAHREALELLEQAEALYGPSCVLDRQRQHHAAALGWREVARTAAARAALHPPRGAWEWDALGQALAREGDLVQALDYFERALDQEPHLFWAHFHKGQCVYQLGRYEEALQAFTVCLALAPDSAWCHYNRGLANAQLGRLGRALRDYDGALELDPRLALAALNRGMLHFRERRYPQAVADLERALSGGADPAMTHYDLALVRSAQGDREAALSEVRLTLLFNPQHADALRLQARLLQAR